MARMTKTISAMLNKMISIVVMIIAVYLPYFVPLYPNHLLAYTPRGAVGPGGRSRSGELPKAHLK